MATSIIGHPALRRVTVLGATAGPGAPQTGTEALLELVEGMRERAGAPTRPLDAATGGPARVREILTGVGQTSR